MVLILLGMKHTGKSSVAPLLANRLGCGWVDLDDEIEKMYGKEESGEPLSFREIYKREGEKKFRELEAEAMKKILQTSPPANSTMERQDIPNLIIATGGGLGDNSKALELAKTADYRIYIDTQSEVLFKRVLRGGLPAYLSREHAWEDFQVIHRRRDKRYRELANIIVPGNEKTPEVISEEIARTFPQRRPDAG